MKVLSIGNSFSQDAQHYLHQIAEKEGVFLKCVNLYIGGCSLQTHVMNMLQNKAAYTFELNGESLGLSVSIGDALRSDDWDAVTLQQVSGQSGRYESYVPYLSRLADTVRLFCPHARILMHQTWAYEQGSAMLNQNAGYVDQHDMFRDIESAYQKAAGDIAANGIIPCGKVMMRAIDRGIGKIHRDTYHADLGVGRYMLGLTWFQALTGRAAKQPFDAFDVEPDERQLALAVQTVREVMGA